MADPIPEQTTPAPITIDPVILTPEVIDDFRLNFDNPGEAFARDLVATFQGDFADRIEEDPNFLTYEGLKSGTAGILDFLPSTQGVTNPARRALTDDQIAILFSNAEEAPFARPFFGEAAKSAPATAAALQTMRVVGPRLITPAASTGNPYVVAGATALTGLAGLGAAGLVYMAGDEIEEQLLGPDIVVTPNQRALYEAYRTAGGFTGGIFTPWALPQNVNLGTQRMIANMAADAPIPLGVRMTRGLENIIGRSGQAARAAPGLTAAGEVAGTAGATFGAYQAEQIFPGQTGPRLLGELGGANTLAATVLRTLPRIVGSGRPDVVGGVVNNRQRQLFENINNLYAQYGTPEQYDALIDNLTSPEFTRQLQEAFPGVDFTAAQRGGDPFIMAIEATKAAGSTPLDAARRNAERASYELMNNFVQGLISQGDENSLRQAAILRQSVFDDIIRTNLQTRVDALLRANERLRTQPGQTAARTQEQLSEQLTDVVDDVINSSRARERELWNNVGDVPVIQPMAPDTPVDELPAFLRAWEDISFSDPALQREFLRAVPQLTDFVNTARRDLGLQPIAPISEADASNIARYQNAVDDAITRLTGVGDRFGMALEELDGIVAGAERLPLNERAAYYRDLAETFTDRIYPEMTTAARRGEQRMSSLMDKMADLSAVQSAAQARAQAQAGETAIETAPIGSNRLIEARSRALDVARGFAANPETRDFGRRIGEFAEAIADDLDVDGLGDAYDTARAYTRARHDVFSRTIVGPSAAATRTGARRVPPEVLFQDFVRSNPSVTLSRVRQLQSMAEWADEQGLTLRSEGMAAGGENIFTTTTNLVDSYLRGLRRVASREVFDPRTGETRTVVNADALNDWKNQNQDLLQAFPQLQIDLADAASAARTLQIFEATAARANRINRNQRYLSQLIGGTSPVVAVGEAFGADNPVRAFTNLFALRRAGAAPMRNRRLMSSRNAAIRGSELTEDEVNRGLQTAMFEFAYLKAGGEGAFNPQVFYQTLFERLPNSRQSLMDLAERFDVVPESTRNRLRFMSEQMVRMQAADAAGRLNDPDFAAQAGPIMDFYVGVLGSAAGSQLYSLTGTTGPGVIAASGAGARELRRLINELPQTKRLEAIDMIFTDPELTASLMMRPQSAAGRERQYNRIINLLMDRGFGVAAGMQPAITRETFEEEDRGTGTPYMGFPGLPENLPEVQRQLQERLRQQNLENMPAPEQQGSLVPPAPTPTPGGGAAPSPVQFASAAPSRPPIQSSGPVDRARFAALFPEDRELLGIGSLMGG